MIRSFNKFVQLITNPIFAIFWIILAMLSYFFADKSIANFIHQLNNPLLSHSGQLITHFGVATYYVPLSLLVFFITKFIWQKPKIAAITLFLLLAIAIPGITCDIIKFIVSRARPIELFHHHVYGFYFFHLKYDFNSFPSGHATCIASLMMALSLLWPRLWPGFMLIMVAVGLSRVVITAHFLSDVMMGWYLGAIMTIYIHRILQHKGLMLYDSAYADETN